MLLRNYSENTINRTCDQGGSFKEKMERKEHFCVGLEKSLMSMTRSVEEGHIQQRIENCFFQFNISYLSNFQKIRTDYTIIQAPFTFIVHSHAIFT